MKYEKGSLIFSENQTLAIVGTPKEIEKVIAFIKNKFKAKREKGWFVE